MTARADRPRILVTLFAYLPGFRSGGPVRTVANMVDQLGDEFDFCIVAADRDLGGKKPYDGVGTDAWTPLGKALVFYRSPGATGWRAMLKSVRSMNFDLIYLNSFFSTASLRPLMYRRLGWLADRPILLAPRGEFSAGALALKPVKKRLFIALARSLGLYRDVTFQASSQHEAADIRCILGAVNIVVASNLSGHSSGPAIVRLAHRSNKPLRAVFLSRISPMKNLIGALDILAQVSCPVDFSIYGIIEDAGYWTRCQQRIAALPSHVTASYLGEVAPDRVDGILSGHDFFLFPTMGENYGHVIREALSAGLPVLISDQTPWRDLAGLNAGADLPLDGPDDFVAWIETFSRMVPAQYDAMRQAARRLGDDPVTAANNLEANRAMLHAAIIRRAGQNS